jgi:hypothetical protein
MVKKQTFESMLEQAQVLRNEALGAETRLLLFLIDFEDSGLWKDGGFNTFATLIRQHKLTRPERYEEFKLAAGKLGAKDVQTIGVGATIQAGRIGDGKTRVEYVAEAKLRVEQDGFPWSEEQAERARMRVSPDAAKPLMRVARQSRLEQELAEAEALIATLKERVEKLETENAKLRGKVAARGRDESRQRT